MVEFHTRIQLLLELGVKSEENQRRAQQIICHKLTVLRMSRAFHSEKSLTRNINAFNTEKEEGDFKLSNHVQPSVSQMSREFHFAGNPYRNQASYSLFIGR